MAKRIVVYSFLIALIASFSFFPKLYNNAEGIMFKEDISKLLNKTTNKTDSSITFESLTANSETSTDEYIDLGYKWAYGRSEWTYNARVLKDHYDYFKGLKRPATDDYSVYVTNPLNHPYISNLVKTFQEGAQKHNYSEWDTINYIVAFVQSLKYVPDEVSTEYDEYPKYPLETLVDGGGDCEDTSILMASILQEMGYGVVLLGMPDHMAIGVKGADNLPGSYYTYNGAHYYYLETTGSNWSIGALPDQFKNKQAKIYPLTPRPVITHSWQAKTVNGLSTQINVQISNEGTATSKNTVVYAAFDAGDNNVYDQTYSKPFDLEPQTKAEITLHLKYPRNVQSRLIVKVISNDVLMDESTSKWQQL
ncbi:hypothetical protein SAMN05660649_01047 [Desulfotomaculum arcticum]|uniref:Transglutaminase-like superfamily protein n=1 Tax=Desulfotruncus arcticus DSM 17038 TaxID=1121424 RepID=A0A1I2Q9L2_9FIRM|nr:hypothetical protein [Desulfotruncus arcticus]SFG22967.1 hypothetical protein SAMN05660649_01047 [Desulfotomaculum arcticum] [Desulfotruncus arcticus DSM 17038]